LKAVLNQSTNPKGKPVMENQDWTLPESVAALLQKIGAKERLVLVTIAETVLSLKLRDRARQTMKSLIQMDDLGFSRDNIRSGVVYFFADTLKKNPDASLDDIIGELLKRVPSQEE
jgi:hypothetical protein